MKSGCMCIHVSIGWLRRNQKSGSGVGNWETNCEGSRHLWKVRSRRLRRFGASAVGPAGMNGSQRMKKAVIIPTAHCQLRSACLVFQGQHPDSCAAHSVVTPIGSAWTGGSVRVIGGTGSRASSTSFPSAACKRKVVSALPHLVPAESVCLTTHSEQSRSTPRFHGKYGNRASDPAQPHIVCRLTSDAVR